MDLTHYEVLGVAADADRETIRVAYRRRARETHPDAGGDEAEFAAVALAWWTLSSAERRAAYDAGTDAEDDWGEDLGWDDPEPARAARPAPPRPGQPVPVRGLPGPDVGGPVDPLTSEPRALPPVPPPAGLASPWTRDRRTATLIGCAAVLLPIVAVLTFPDLASGEISSTAWTGLFAYSGVLAWALWWRSRTHQADRVSRVVTAVGVWGAVVVFALMGTGYLSDGVSPVRSVVVGVPLLVGILLAVDSGRRVRRTRRRVQREQDTRRYRALARRWNRLLTLRAQHGAAHVEAGQRDGRLVWHLVADGSGQVLDWAPLRAVHAWSRLVREAGVDVAPVPEPAVGPDDARVG